MRMGEGVDDEVAALRAAAAKAREDAQKLAKEMGKDIDTEPAQKPGTPPPKPQTLTPEELQKLTSSIDFESGNAESQTTELDSLVQSGKLQKWKGAVRTNPLRTYPVSLKFLEDRSNGKITAESLAVSAETEVNLDDFKDATIGVVGVSTVLAIGSLAFLPENIGATLCYLFALIPVVYLGIGSSAPGLIAGPIAALKGTADDPSQKEDRICRHEAAHFLCGYLCGLPVQSYDINQEGFPSVAFHASSDPGLVTAPRELTREEIAALSVVAMSGSVGELFQFDVAKGGQNDLIELNAFFRRSKEFLSAQNQQDLTRWGALQAYNLLRENMNAYEGLVEAFKQKKSVAECVQIVESN